MSIFEVCMMQLCDNKKKVNGGKKRLNTIKKVDTFVGQWVLFCRLAKKRLKYDKKVVTLCRPMVTLWLQKNVYFLGCLKSGYALSANGYALITKKRLFFGVPEKWLHPFGQWLRFGYKKTFIFWGAKKVVTFCRPMGPIFLAGTVRLKKLELFILNVGWNKSLENC